LRQSPLHPWRQNPGPHEPRSCILWDIALCGEISDNACCTQIQKNLSLGLICRYLDTCTCQLDNLEGSLGSCVGTRYPWPSQRLCMLQSQCTCPDTCRSSPGSDFSEFECNKRCLRFPHTEQCPTECSCEAHEGQDFAAMDAVVIDARVVGRSTLNQLTQSFLSWIPKAGLP
jgi:hypothetical protein